MRWTTLEVGCSVLCRLIMKWIWRFLDRKALSTVHRRRLSVRVIWVVRVRRVIILHLRPWMRVVRSLRLSVRYGVLFRSRRYVMSVLVSPLSITR